MYIGYGGCFTLGVLAGAIITAIVLVIVAIKIGGNNDE